MNGDAPDRGLVPHHGREALAWLGLVPVALGQLALTAVVVVAL